MDHIKEIAQQLKIDQSQVMNTLSLLEEGNTVPFIARYRKEMTKGLDEEQIRTIQEVYEYGLKLEKRKEDVLRIIETQGKLTAEIREQVLACEKLSEVEDLYRPYQQKRKTSATEAVAKGLKPLADWLLSLPVKGDVMEMAQSYCSEQVTSAMEALQGAKDIIAEHVSDDAELRKRVRASMANYGVIQTKAKKNHEDEEKVYQMYYDYEEKIKYMAPHRLMAIQRAENEKVIKVSLVFDQQYQIDWAKRRYTKNRESIANPYIYEAVEDGCKRLVFPSVENEVRRERLDQAHEQSIDIFAMNVEKLLLQTPMKNKMIMGLDPAFRTGCKLALIDGTGKLLAIDVIYPHAPVHKIKEAEETMMHYLRLYPIDIIAIGNGTASRESEAFVANLIRKYQLNVAYTMVSEAGASVYSASELAKREFPDLHVEQRSAVSIARRVLDPLAELIKIDPKSIGVGQYQHDLPEARLSERLDFVVSKAVNRVGVNVNTASQQLLNHISGLTNASAKAIVTYRNEKGLFANREQLKQVPRLGEKSYQQAVGFLRIEDGDHPFDRTSIHPESYPIALQMLKDAELSEKQLGTPACFDVFANWDVEETASHYQVDRYTAEDILNALKQPLRDYRDTCVGPLLKKDILTMDDLKEGMELEGVVRNVVDFGAFIDIGLKNDALVHISKMSTSRIKHPSEVVQIGDILTVWIDTIDQARKKVQLTLVKPK
ncbi:MAG: Tex family protein [Erysipelotrichaceae bacterium]|nr:Tex family protein [Erysipelotrichaceae bacterium]